MSYIPFRIKALKIDGDELIIEHKIFSEISNPSPKSSELREDTGANYIEQTVIKKVKKNDILFFSMGLVKVNLGKDRVEPSKLRKLITRGLFGEVGEGLDIDLKPRYREMLLIDFITKDNMVYRIEDVYFNYRALLGDEVTLSTELNFRKLVKLLQEALRDVKTDGSLEAFLSKGRKGVPVYPNLLEFQEYCIKQAFGGIRENTTDDAAEILDEKKERFSENQEEN